MLPFNRAVRQTKLEKNDAPVLLSTPVCESGRRFADQATALNERDGRNIYPILDHAGAEASVWSRERAQSASSRPSLVTGRIPHEMASADWTRLEHHYASKAQELLQKGYEHLIFGADGDGLVAAAMQRNLPKTDELQARVLGLFHAVQKQTSRVGVALCVEDCAPGGNDASDGIVWAQIFEAAGAAYFIASGGSWAFPPLKERKVTKAKNDVPVVPNQAWMASPAWLLGRVEVPVYACGPTSDPEKAVEKALHAGFAGLVHWQDSALF